MVSVTAGSTNSWSGSQKHDNIHDNNRLISLLKAQMNCTDQSSQINVCDRIYVSEMTLAPPKRNHFQSLSSCYSSSVTQVPPHFPHESSPTHRAVDVFAALLILLLYPLLQEVDAELEAEVLLLQVIQVLRQSTVTVRHDRQRAPTLFDMSLKGQKWTDVFDLSISFCDTESTLKDSDCQGKSLNESPVTVRHATSFSKRA